MKKMILTLVAASALTAAAMPAAAATNDRHGAPDRHGANNINAHQAQIEQRINQGLRSHRLSQREATMLRTQVRQVVQLEARYRVNGLQTWERRDLDRRLDRIDVQVTAQLNDRNGHAAGYGGGQNRR